MAIQGLPSANLPRLEHLDPAGAFRRAQTGEKHNRLLDAQIAGAQQNQRLQSAKQRVELVGRALLGSNDATSMRQNMRALAQQGVQVDPEDLNVTDQTFAQRKQLGVSQAQSVAQQISQAERAGVRQQQQSNTDRQFNQTSKNQNALLGLRQQEVGRRQSNADRAFSLNQQNVQSQIRARDTKTAQSQLPNANISKSQLAFDKIAVKELAPFAAGGGFADAQKQIDELDGAIALLKGETGILGDSLTGPVIGNTPDAVGVFQERGRAAIDLRERVESVVQRNLRLVLGAQFTEKEGVRLISRAFNPKLPPARNASRLRALSSQMKIAIRVKQRAAAYLDANGTLKGFTEKIPTLSDFRKAVSGKSNPKVRLKFNPSSGQIE